MKPLPVKSYYPDEPGFRSHYQLSDSVRRIKGLISENHFKQLAIRLMDSSNSVSVACFKRRIDVVFLTRFSPKDSKEKKRSLR